MNSRANSFRTEFARQGLLYIAPDQELFLFPEFWEGCPIKRRNYIFAPKQSDKSPESRKQTAANISRRSVMTQKFFVGSKTQGSVFSVEGQGFDVISARQSAIQFARARYQIADPVQLTEHEAAVRSWRNSRKEFAPKMNAA